MMDRNAALVPASKDVVCDTWDSGSSFEKDFTKHAHESIRQYIIEKLFQPFACYTGYQVLDRFCPKPSDKDSALLSIYENISGYKEGKRLAGKPGKIIKRLCPWITEKECEAFACWYKEVFVLSGQGYRIKSGSKATDFLHAYIHEQSMGSDPSLGRYFKSLASSCMRFEFSDLSRHPVETYASGDFVIHWVEDSIGKIASRVIVYGEEAGPIYTNSDIAANFLKDHLLTLNVTSFECNFDGARLLKIPCRYGDSVIVPYVDSMEYAEDGNKFLTLRSDQPDSDYYRVNTTQGSASLESCFCCDACGQSCSEDELTCTYDQSLCESCLDDSYQQCDNGEYYLKEECVEVFNSTRYGINSEWYHRDDLDDSVYCENEDEYWCSGDVTFVECEDIYVPTRYVGNDYFESIVDSQWYPVCDKVYTDLGYMTKEQAQDACLVLIGEVWKQVSEAYLVVETTKEVERYNEDVTITTTSLVLRDNYELDSTGEPIRNPDLFDCVELETTDYNNVTYTIERLVA